MKEEYRTRIQEIIDGMECPKDFKCAEGGFENLCKTKYFGGELFLHGNRETAAVLLGISIRTLWRKTQERIVDD